MVQHILLRWPRLVLLGAPALTLPTAFAALVHVRWRRCSVFARDRSPGCLDPTSADRGRWCSSLAHAGDARTGPPPERWRAVAYASFFASGLMFWWLRSSRGRARRDGLVWFRVSVAATLPCDARRHFVFSGRVVYPANSPRRAIRLVRSARKVPRADVALRHDCLCDTSRRLPPGCSSEASSLDGQMMSTRSLQSRRHGEGVGEVMTPGSARPADFWSLTAGRQPVDRADDGRRLLSWSPGRRSRVSIQALCHTVAGNHWYSARYPESVHRTTLHRLMRRDGEAADRAGRIEPSHGLAFDIALFRDRSAVAVNALSAALAALMMASYLLVYTPLKRRPFCRGRRHPRCGATAHRLAATGLLSPEAGCCARWCPVAVPHFMATPGCTGGLRPAGHRCPRRRMCKTFMVCRPWRACADRILSLMLCCWAGLSTRVTALGLDAVVYRDQPPPIDPVTSAAAIRVDCLPSPDVHPAGAPRRDAPRLPGREHVQAAHA